MMRRKEHDGGCLGPILSLPCLLVVLLLFVLDRGCGLDIDPHRPTFLQKKTPESLEPN